jgi:glycosyltransferase involved in cell wall biosynthesis
MKVLHIVESFAGGVLTSVSQLCNLQVNDGKEVILAHSVRPETPANFQDGLDHRVEIRRINLGRQIAPFQDLLGLLEIRKIIKQTDPDIIHLHSSKAGFIGRLAVFLGNKKPKVFYSPRGFAFLQINLSPLKRRLYFILERIGVAFDGTILACSASEAKEAARLKAKDVVVIENAVDTGIIPVKQIKPAKKALLKVGTLGRVCPQKNPGLFKTVAEQFLSQDDLQFVWIGGGQDDYKLSLVKNLKLTGWLPRKTALSLLAELDIYLQISLWEGMPLSVLEAMVSGIPAIVTDAVGNRDTVIHGETGFIAKTMNEVVYFIDLLARDTQFRLAIGHKARQVALQRFGLDRLKAEIDHLYLFHSQNNRIGV